MLIKNARIVTRDEEFTGVVRVADGRITEVAPGTTSVAEAEDWGGDYLLPGLVELHTDNIEKHIAPRPGVVWNHDAAILVHDAQVATAGITTVFDALGIGSRGGVGVRGKEIQTNCARSIERLAGLGLLRVDHFLHLRCEVAAADVIYPMIVDGAGRIGWFPGLQEEEPWRVIRQATTPAEYLERCGPGAVSFSWSPGVCLLVTARALRSVGPPRGDYWVRGEDLEFSLRLTSRFRSAFVPTVVPQTKSTPVESVSFCPTKIFSSASAIASAGLCGVEGSFRIWRRPLRTKTQSVKVPPVSIAMRMRTGIVAQDQLRVDS